MTSRQARRRTHVTYDVTYAKKKYDDAGDDDEDDDDNDDDCADDSSDSLNGVVCPCAWHRPTEPNPIT